MTDPFKFANLNYLYLLLVLPFFLILFLYALQVRKKNIKKFGELSLLKSLMPEVSISRLHVKFWLFFVALALIIIALARPQFGSKIGTVKKEGVEIMIALDVSNSMLSQDKELSVNRLEKAKQIISRLIDNLGNDKVGLVVFAGEAYIQLPITTDFISAKMFLSTITPNLVPVQGTAIGRAIELCEQSFTMDESTEKAIIVLTDGENHEDDPVTAAQEAAKSNIRVHVIGIGSPEGSPIPVSSQITNTFRKDRNGNVIITKLDEAVAQQIASAGNGIYVRADNSNNAQKALEKEIDKMAKSEYESSVYTEYEEQFPVFIWIALFLLLIELILFDRKNRIFRKVKLFDNLQTKI
ncbi:MAG: VWA domain-containing protein [Candidatus Azobacteroides sp.]|nr:VWA domain-containing protein [Candidatus Azobacteroides sp.]